jgi:FkbM family methyltransferase
MKVRWRAGWAGSDRRRKSRSRPGPSSSLPCWFCKGSSPGISSISGETTATGRAQTGLAQKHRDLAGDPRVKIEYAGVGDFDGSAAFSFHQRDDSCSFLYDAEEAARLGMPQETLPICRLDTAMATSPFGPPQMIKIDAEGLDLTVLAGGPQAIAGAEIVLVEATVACAAYPNTVAIVFAKMDALGFRLFDITDLNRTPERRVLWLIEAVFVRKDAELASKVQVYI